MSTRPPPRRQDSEIIGEDAPPPAYEAVPTQSGEQTLEYGPSRPFQQVPPPPPSHPSRVQQHQQQQQQQPSSSPSLAPPMFPFWNGAGLSPQQTGFNPNSSSPYPQQQQHHHQYQQQPQQQQQFQQPQSYYSPSPPPAQMYSPPPPPQHQQNQPHYSPPPPPTSTQAPIASTSNKPYAPTTVATPAQPLLNKGKLLVFPPNKLICPKCLDTGYKNNDPSHPCRKCWSAYGKTFSPALLFAPGSPASTNNSTPSNLQKPLNTFSSPTTIRPRPPIANNGYPGTVNYNNLQQRPMVMNNSHAPLVVHPGDPRIGGQLCGYCRGAGVISTAFSFFSDTETCPYCRGSGRIF